MLSRIAEDVRQCLEHAAEAGKRAQSPLNSERKAGFLEMERRWLRLAAAQGSEASLGEPWADTLEPRTAA